jgi:dTDP-4-amino-4,6-dideoxygalactose transaminase
MPVHVYGNVGDLEKIEEIAKKHNLKIIYDAAHAFGTKYKGKSIGCYGDASIFSFHATKLFNTLEGGCAIFKKEADKKNTDLLKNFGIESENEITECGINAKLNELQSAIGLLNLELLEKERGKRQKIKNIYDKALGKIEGIKINHKNVDVDSLQYYPIRIEKEKFGINRDELQKILKEQGFNCRKYFYPLLSNIAIYQSNPSAKKENLLNSNKASEEVLCLPFYGDLSIKNAQLLCKKIIKIKQEN